MFMNFLNEENLLQLNIDTIEAYTKGLNLTREQKMALYVLRYKKGIELKQALEMIRNNPEKLEEYLKF